MIGNPIFYHSTIRKSVVAFGHLFDDISIQRTNANNVVQQIIRVPLTYAAKNKLLLRADQDPDATKDDAIVLPRMAFEMLPPFSYDGSRKLPALEKYAHKHDTIPNKLRRQYVPVPYDINFNLYIYVNNLEDGNKIIEQILPFFTPDWTISMNLITDMDLTFDVPIVLRSVSPDDTHFDGQFNQRRVMIWTLSFVMKTYFLGPIKNKPIIKFAHERIFFADNVTDAVGNTDAVGEIIVSPGLDANGDATSNASITVDANVIFVDDDYGYIESFSSGPISFS